MAHTHPLHTWLCKVVWIKKAAEAQHSLVLKIVKCNKSECEYASVSKVCCVRVEPDRIHRSISIYEHLKYSQTYTYTTNTRTKTRACTHSVSTGLLAGSGHSTTLQQEVPASRSRPITAQYLTRKVPLRKSHVTLGTLDSSHDRLCFFLPVNARNPLRSSGGDTEQGNNARMDPAIVPECCCLTNVRPCCFISGWAAVQNWALNFTWKPGCVSDYCFLLTGNYIPASNLWFYTLWFIHWWI